MPPVYKTVFIGNESPYLSVLKECSDLGLIVCDPIRGNAKKYFGSAHQFARENQIPVSSPRHYIRKPVKTDIIIVSGYHQRVPLRVIEVARISAVNIHQSLLPAYRGRHPINWAIIKGEKYTGITLHHLTERFDEGRIILQKRVKITDNDTVMDVYRKTVEIGKDLLLRLFQIVETENFKGYEQDAGRATYFPPRTPKDGKIEWSDTARNIRNLIRALTYPYPGAYFYCRGIKLVIEEAEVIKFNHKGLLLGRPFFTRKAILVKTGVGTLKIKKLRNRNIAMLYDLFRFDYKLTGKGSDF